MTESTSIRLGASHTFTLTINSIVTLEKERWDLVALMRLEEMENLGERIDKYCFLRIMLNR